MKPIEIGVNVDLVEIYTELSTEEQKSFREECELYEHDDLPSLMDQIEQEDVYELLQELNKKYPKTFNSYISNEGIANQELTSTIRTLKETIQKLINL